VSAEKNFYTETKGHAFAFCPVAHATLALAEAEAARSSHDCFEVRVYDCSAGPVGTLVCKYVRGVRVDGEPVSK
jgi:hypothetical protein